MCSNSESKQKCKFEVRLDVNTFEQNRDSEGYCWFHSFDYEWKKSVDFKLIFQNFINYHREDTGIRFLDFSQAIFGNSINDLLNMNIGDLGLMFNNCIINSTIKLRDLKFESTLSFKSAKVNGDFSITNGYTNGLDLNSCTIKGNMFLTGHLLNSYFNLNDGSISGGLSFTNCQFEQLLSGDGLSTNGDGAFKRMSQIANCTFNNQVTFRNAVIRKSLIFIDSIINGRISFLSTNFKCDFSSPTYASVHFSNNTLTSTGSITFKGKPGEQIFSESIDVVISKNKGQGIISFEHANLQKIDKENRKLLVQESLKADSSILIGANCLKYFNQSPIREIRINKDLQNLATDICNTFIKYFSSTSGFNLGIEITERTDSYIKYFYFSDEPIHNEEFLKKLKEEELNMWSLVHLEKQEINISENTKVSPRNKILGTTDTLVDLAGILIKIASRIPLLKFNKKEIQTILNSASLDPNSNSIDASNISSLNINQTILLGVGNSQTAS